MRRTKISNLQCSVCGQNFPLPRRKSKLRKGGHIKDLWCVRCEKSTKHLEDHPKKYK